MRPGLCRIYVKTMHRWDTAGKTQLGKIEGIPVGILLTTVPISGLRGLP